MARTIKDYVLAGTWRFESIVGRGADGTVYRAHEMATGRPVAIKVYDSLVDHELREIERRIAHESALIRHVASPHMVEFIASGVARARGGRHTAYLVMEFLAGQSLREWLHAFGVRASGTVPYPIFLEVLRAVHTMHVHRVAHLDLKPENLVVLAPESSSKAKIKILDLGASRIEGPVDPARASRGTPVYASPEQCLRSGDVGPASDVYSLGILLYEIVTGTIPLDGDSPEAFVSQHAFGRIHSFPRVDGLDAVARIYRRATALEPWRRYKTAGEMHDELLACVS